MVGKDTSVTMPFHIVNQSRLEAEYAVPIADLLLCVHPGRMPGLIFTRFDGRQV